MKKITIYIMIFVATTTWTSCDDMLDKKPYSYFDEEVALRTSKGMNALLNGIYDGFTSYYYYGRQIYAYEAAKGIDFFVRLKSGGRFEVENQYNESFSYGSATWTKLYSTIRTATFLLENIDQVTDIDPTQLDLIKGEAAALRALTYFDLMRMFAYPPLFSTPLGAKYDEKYKWGVPIIHDVETASNIYKYTIRREEADSCFRYIENEFLIAKSLLEGKSSREGHINYVAVCTLLSRLYLYQSRWDDAIFMGEEALRVANIQYALIPYESYKTSYYKPFNSESIFELSYSVTDNLSSNALNYLIRRPTYDNPGASNDGKVSQNIGYSAYGLFNVAINLLTYSINGVEDVRGYLVCELGIEGKNYKTLRKYKGEPYHYVHNIPIVRLPEIYLTLAEAYAEKNEMDDAVRYFDKTRMARVKTSGFTKVIKADIIKEILDERRRELMLEGHTYWDNFRRGERLTRQVIEACDDATITFGSKTQVVYPIPLDEQEANAAIREQQNPGYGTYNLYE